MNTVVDVVVIGAGVAGCTLAWAFHRVGKTVMLVDRNEQATASRVAAGLIAPLSGPRLLPSWHVDAAWEACQRFYHALPEPVLHLKPKCHIFQSADDRAVFEQRRLEFPQYIHDAEPVLDSAIYHAPFGGFEMTHSAWVDVNRFLNLTRNHFPVTVADIAPATDFRWTNRLVEMPRLGCTAKLVVWCEGAFHRSQGHFAGLKYQHAKGEVLTLRIPNINEDRVIHQGVWLNRLHDDVYRCGANYAWNDFTSEPTATAREWILQRLRQFLKAEVTVLDQHAAVRPILQDLKPICGYHPRCRQLAIFNGLGSKGTLLAPYLAERFATGKALPDDVRVERSCGIVLPARLTEQAQTRLLTAIKPGDHVIDATAGNGHDTAFLSHRVGRRGRVYAIDIQPQAIRTIQQLNRPNVTAILADHAELAQLIPPEIRGRITAIMFNLGYLPTGDHSIITKPKQTVQAISQAVALLKFGGMMTVLAYTGHPGGTEEANAVIAFLAECPEITWEEVQPEPWLVNVPRLLLIQKR